MTNLLKIKQTIQAESEGRHRHQNSLRVAKALMTHLQLPQGNQLVYLLRYPTATDNLSAVTQWVHAQERQGPLISTTEYDLIECRLRIILEELAHAG